MRDEAAFKARAGAALSVREKLLEVVKQLTTEVEATIARCEAAHFSRGQAVRHRHAWPVPVLQAIAVAVVCYSSTIEGRVRS